MGAITTARADDLTIGKLSRLTGVNIETIRYYEKIKVLPAPSRTENGRRAYGPIETRILAFHTALAGAWVLTRRSPRAAPARRSRKSLMP
jgi:hypothetical protein